MRRRDLLMISCIILSPLLFAIGNIVMPALLSAIIVDISIIDTSAKLDAVFSKPPEPTTLDMIFMNLTNGRELLTVSPPPKPIFVEVPIKVRSSSDVYDYSLSPDAATVNLSVWGRLEPANPEDLHLSIVTAHDMLPYAFTVCGGETLMQTLSVMNLNVSGPAAWCKEMYISVKQESQNLRPDGTTPNNMGLFVRRTINELFNGYVSPLPVLQGMRIPNMILGDNSMFPTSASLKDMVAAGILRKDRMEVSIFTGKGDFERLGALHSVQGFTHVSSTQNDALYKVFPVPWDNHGIISPTSTFQITGERGGSTPLVTTLMPPPSKAPSYVSAGYPAKASPRSTSFSFNPTKSLFRALKYSCGSCIHELMHNNLYVVKYTMDERMGWLTNNGTKDEEGHAIGTCSIGLCDFGMTAPFVWPYLYPLSGIKATLPYFGRAPSELRNSTIFMNQAGAELSYDETTMWHEIYVDPFTSRAVKYNTPLMYSLELFDRQAFDGNLFANVMSSPSIPRLLPTLYHTHRETVTKSMLNAMTSMYLAMYLAMALLTIISFIICACVLKCCISNLMKRMRAHPLGGMTSTSEPRPSKRVKPDIFKKASKPQCDDKLRLSKEVHSEISSMHSEMPQATMTIDISARRPPSFTVNSSASPNPHFAA